MKRWLIGLAVVVIVLVAGTATLAALLVDAEAIRSLAVEQGSAALGREVGLGELDVVVFPAPAVRARALRVAGDPGAPDLLQADEIRLRVALWPLFSGRVEVAALDLTNPVVRLPVDKAGMPRVPELGSEPKKKASPSAGASESADGSDDGGSGAPVALAIEALRLEGGRLEAGVWKVDALQISGALDLEGESRFAASLELPEVGAIREIDVRLQGLLTDAPDIRVSAELDAFQLAALAKRAGLVPEPLGQLGGTLAGSVEARIAAGAVAESSGELTVSSLDLVAGETRVAGDVPIRFALGGALEVDLTGAEVTSPPLSKPRGERLVVAGELGQELSPAALRRIRLGIGPNDVNVVPDLARQRARIEPGRFEIGPIAPWLDLGERRPGGALAIEQPLEVRLDPLRVDGQIQLQGVRYPLEQGDAQLDGPVVARGTQIRFEDLRAQIGDQPLRLAGSYALDSGQVTLDLGADKAQVQPMLVAAAGKSNLLGVLGAQINLAGAPTLEGIGGSGRFDISPGQIEGFSLLRQVLGPLGQAAEQVLQAKGKDLSRYQEERFEHLTGDFALAGGVLQIRSLALVYQYGRADLRGTLRLADGALALRGRVTLAPAVASDVLRTETDEPLELADVPIGCNVDAPCVQLDARTLAGVVTRVAARRAVGSRIQEKLEEKLGSKEDADAVRGVLEGILGGGRKRER